MIEIELYINFSNAEPYIKCYGIEAYGFEYFIMTDIPLH